MKYYSEKLQALYNSAEECQKAEFEAKEAENRERIRKEREEREKKEREKKQQEQEEKLANERKTRANEVEVARKAMVAAQKRYRELLETFVRDYHTYHLSLNDDDVKKIVPTLFDFFNIF